MGLFSKLFRSRDAPVVNILPGDYYAPYFGRSTAGKPVTERTSMQVAAVYACVRVLAESVAQLPLNLYRYTDKGKEKALRHPLYRILHDEPNPEMTAFSLVETMMAHLALWGNAYCQIVRNGMGDVVGLYPLLPDRMEVDRVDGEIVYQYTRYEDEAKTIPQDVTYFTRRDILHIPGMGFDGLVGYSPIAMAKNAVGIASATEEYGAKFFANGAAPGGILSHPGVIKDPEKLRAAWHSQFGGSGNAGKIAVLEEGMSYQQIGIAPEEAQFLETRKFQIDEIARIFRIPPHMIGDLEHATFSNIEQQSLEFVQFTLDPWLTQWEQSINRALLRPQEKADYFVKFNVDKLMRGDYATRMSGYATARQNGWMSANDIRELEDMDRIPAEQGGDLYLINGAMLPMSDAGAYANKNTNTSATGGETK